jgi:thiol-disulfide isomerase/thioredoxin
MNIRCHRLLTTLAAAALALASLATLAAGVTVHTLDGNSHGLGEQLDKSKWNVVMVYTTYCHICRRQYPILSAFHDKHQASDAVVLGIALDGLEKSAAVQAYRVDQAHSFPSVIADAGQFGALYERATGEAFTGIPTYLVFDKSGSLQAYLDGPVTLAALETFLSK